jgi:hypothetical protein
MQINSDTKTIFVSHRGDDGNDGLSEETSVRSLFRALELAGRHDKLKLASVTTLYQLAREIERGSAQIYSKSDWG